MIYVERLEYRAHKPQSSQSGISNLPVAPEILQRRVMEQAEWKIMPQAIRLIAEGKVRVENGKTIITE